MRKENQARRKVFQTPLTQVLLVAGNVLIRFLQLSIPKLKYVKQLIMIPIKDMIELWIPSIHQWINPINKVQAIHSVCHSLIHSLLFKDQQLPELLLQFKYTFENDWY